MYTQLAGDQGYFGLVVCSVKLVQVVFWTRCLGETEVVFTAKALLLGAHTGSVVIDVNMLAQMSRQC